MTCPTAPLPVALQPHSSFSGRVAPLTSAAPGPWRAPHAGAGNAFAQTPIPNSQFVRQNYVFSEKRCKVWFIDVCTAPSPRAQEPAVLCRATRCAVACVPVPLSQRNARRNEYQRTGIQRTGRRCPGKGAWDDLMVSGLGLETLRPVKTQCKKNKMECREKRHGTRGCARGEATPHAEAPGHAAHLRSAGDPEPPGPVLRAPLPPRRLWWTATPELLTESTARQRGSGERTPRRQKTAMVGRGLHAAVADNAAPRSVACCARRLLGKVTPPPPRPCANPPPLWHKALCHTPPPLAKGLVPTPPPLWHKALCHTRPCAKSPPPLWHTALCQPPLLLAQGLVPTPPPLHKPQESQENRGQIGSRCSDKAVRPRDALYQNKAFFFWAQTHKFFVSARPDGPDQ